MYTDSTMWKSYWERIQHHDQLYIPKIKNENLRAGAEQERNGKAQKLLEHQNDILPQHALGYLVTHSMKWKPASF